jgi:hydrogenase-4 component B
MTLLLISLGILMAGALVCAVAGRTRLGRIGPYVAMGACTACAAAGLIGLRDATSVMLVLPWQLPFGRLRLGLDPLSAFFVLLIGLIGALAAIYGRSYLHGQDARRTALSWCWYNLLIAAMLLVVMARNGFVFLTAWEVMSLTSFFLVMHDHEKEGVMRAGWIYLIATHLATAFLLIMFLLLADGHSLDFARFSAAGGTASLIFVAALIGFGTKAGLMPLHIWLPEAHPVAPSHVSALMSGVMIKMGIYGLLRVTLFLGQPQPWWGWTLVALGAATGLLGVLFALVQPDLKRLLAYSSVENIGIIVLAMGLGLLGTAAGHPAMAAMGYFGALAHVLNHALFKSLLFLGAGAVLHATGTGRMDRLGGLMRRMPLTGAVFLVGSAAICALPPFNGFVSEFLIYAAAFSAVDAGQYVWCGLLAVAGMALIGGLAAACFVKAFGIVFLGAGRSPAADRAHEALPAMRGVMLGLALACAAVGLSAPWILRGLAPVVNVLMPGHTHLAVMPQMQAMLTRVSWMALALIACTTLVYGIRFLLLRGRDVRHEVTWDCGYAAPTARMQYTGSSFVDPIAKMFAALLRTRTHLHSPRGPFPGEARLMTDTPDLFVRMLFEPALHRLRRLAVAFRNLQQGRIHQCILYIVATILLLLVWNLGW